MASSSGWKSSTDEGVIGNNNYPEKQNASGFSALPGGGRFSNGTFLNIGSYGGWWSATERGATNAWGRGMYGHDSGVYSNTYYDRYYGKRGMYGHDSGVYSYLSSKELGFSVRCVRD